MLPRQQYEKRENIRQYGQYLTHYDSKQINPLLCNLMYMNAASCQNCSKFYFQVFFGMISSNFVEDFVNTENLSKAEQII